MIKKRILGIDYGDFTIGLAIFDLETNFIYPYKTIFRSRASAIKKSVREIVGVIYEEGISDIVIGYPLNADGTEGERVEKVKEFAKKIENALTNAERERKLDSVNHDVNVPAISSVLDVEELDLKDAAIVTSSVPTVNVAVSVLPLTVAPVTVHPVNV